MHKLYILARCYGDEFIERKKTYIDVRGHRVDRHGEINEEDRHA
jgi:hypothetical protein